MSTQINMSNHKIDIEEVELSVAKFMDLCYDHDLDGMKKHKEAFFEYVQCDFRMEDVVEQLFWMNPSIPMDLEFSSRLIEIFKFMVDNLQGDERESFVLDFSGAALCAGATNILEYIETSGIIENFFGHLSESIKLGTSVPFGTTMDWVLERDPSLLPYIYHECDHLEYEELKCFVDLFAEHGYCDNGVPAKRRKELVQKIGSILDENTSTLKENDYRVCMDALKDLM